MIATVGQLSLSLTLLLAFSCLVFGAVGGYKRNHRIANSIEWLYYATAIGVCLTTIILTTALLSSDFSLRYVWMYTNRTLDPIYKVTALWGGQEGSMLFWCLILAITSSIAIASLARRRRDLLPYTIAVFGGILLFFHTVMVFAENPFARLNTVPIDGRGLNPLLQNWSMIIHPPCLYLGFILCSVPFAISVACLLNNAVDKRWIQETRVWTIFAWLFLTAGNLLGGQWAYKELGWGGFWAWDPVENAAIMPWFTTTAYMHSIMVQEKRSMLKMWNYSLVSISFCLTILGTFLTRSGIVTSVHSFAKSNLGTFFLVFLMICVVFCILLAWTRRNSLKSHGHIDALVSRESSFVLNNILLTFSSFAILWGTLFPVFSEMISGNKITVGPPFFNSFMVPIGLALLFLMGIGQVIPYRKTSWSRAKKLFLYPISAAILVAMATLATLKSWDLKNIYVTLSFSLSTFVLIGILQEYARGVRLRRKTQKESLLQAMGKLLLNSNRRFGGYTVHFAFLLVVLGISGLAFKVEKEIFLLPGASTTIGDYKITYNDLNIVSDKHKDAAYADLTVESDTNAFNLAPARFFYRTNSANSDQEPQMSTEVALRSTLAEDLYTVLHSFNTESKAATFMFTVNPLVMWLWIGGFVMLFGIGLVLLPGGQRKHATTLELEKQSLVNSLKELDEDQLNNNITADDYKSLRDDLVAAIARLNKRIENKQQQEQNILAQIKTDLNNVNVNDAAENLICPTCKLPNTAQAKFCSSCGEPIKDV